MDATLHFHGAAGTVTGSCYRIETPAGQILVDCGLFQGAKTVRELNYRALPFDARKISCLLLTHAHIDHAGLVPKLFKAGFQGPVLATEGSVDLARVMLPDSGYIQETEVERLNRRNAQRGRPAVTPIYGKADAEAALSLFKAVDYGRWTEVLPGVRARFWNAGHILGAASIEVEIADHGRKPAQTVLFSGDIGPENKLFHPEPDGPSGIDVLVMEATYGGRTRGDGSPEERREELAREVETALASGGPLLIPAFAVERTQELLTDLLRLMRSGRVPKTPIFLDSPLAIRATEIFAAHAQALEDPLTRRDWAASDILRFSESREDSKAIHRLSKGFIVMAASGMCEAGRIRHNLKHYLWRREATVLITGYQAGGTLGAALLAGEPFVRIHGEEVAVRARIRRIDAYSGHADGPQLVAWAQARLPVRRAVYLTHGEPRALHALAGDLAAVGVDAAKIHIPELDSVAPLSGPRKAARREGSRLPEGGRASGEDWRNDYARLLLSIERKVTALPDEKSREKAVAKLRRVLESL